MINQKKKTKHVKNLGGYTKIDRDQLKDIDYMDRLTEEDSVWYNRFLDNEYNARTFKDGKDVINDPETLRFNNKMKARRRNDLYNILWEVDQDPKSNNVIMSVSDSNHKRKSKVKSSGKVESIPSNKTYQTQSLEEFLKSGGKIRKVTTDK
jgi:hypothetical protein